MMWSICLSGTTLRAYGGDRGNLGQLCECDAQAVQSDQDFLTPCWPTPM